MVNPNELKCASKSMVGFVSQRFCSTNGKRLVVFGLMHYRSNTNAFNLSLYTSLYSTFPVHKLV